jgi:carboxyl-terminal processing protease
MPLRPVEKEEPGGHRETCQGHCVMSAELFHDVNAVTVDGVHRDPKAVCDFAVPTASGHFGEHFFLPSVRKEAALALASRGLTRLRKLTKLHAFCCLLPAGPVLERFEAPALADVGPVAEQSRATKDAEATSIPPNEVIRAIVSAIDGSYLYALSNPVWRRVRKRLMAATHRGSTESYPQIAQQLATLKDSELHLVTPNELADLQSESAGARIGVGLIDFAIDVDPSTGEPRVVTPIQGSPAAKLGIRPGDVLVAINEKPCEGMEHEQVLDALRQGLPEGIRLRVRRGGRELSFQLWASSERLQSVTFAMKRSAEAKVGYVQLLQFTPDAGEKMRDAIINLERDGADSYLLDIRNNPGGFLSAAEDVAGAFTTGILGYKVTRDGRKTTIDTQGLPLTAKPLVVLINGGTASAAELLASGLRFQHRAVLVGSRSYGRGQAQLYVALPNGYGVVVPTNRASDPEWGLL